MAEGQSKAKAGKNALKQQLHDKFASDPALANVKFRVNKGVVTLIGKVDSADEVARAKELAMSVDGVKSVRNRLKVASTSAAAGSGINPSEAGRPLLVMPSQDYNRLSDADAGALIAYTKSLPATAGEGAVIRFPFLIKALYAAGVVPDAAELIDHTLPPAAPVPVGATVEHGNYVANMCIGCHGPGLGGGKIPGGPPEWPAASNLTAGQGSALARYESSEKLRAMFRTGKRPDGSAVSKVMPFQSLRVLNDTDVDALYAYLKTVAPRVAGSR